MARINLNACRVCRCTEERACDGGCSWVPVERGLGLRDDVPIAPLCSACAGTEGDVVEATRRIAGLQRRKSGGFEVVQEAAQIARALSKRVKARAKHWRWGPF